MHETSDIQSLDIALDTARTVASPATVPASGDHVYVDPATDGVAHIALVSDVANYEFTAVRGARITAGYFRSIQVLNPAQLGKRLRLIVSSHVRFAPGIVEADSVIRYAVTQGAFAFGGANEISPILTILSATDLRYGRYVKVDGLLRYTIGGAEPANSFIVASLAHNFEIETAIMNNNMVLNAGTWEVVSSFSVKLPIVKNSASATALLLTNLNGACNISGRHFLTMSVLG